MIGTVPAERLIKPLVLWLDRWKIAVVAVAAVLLVLGGMGMQRVTFDPDVLVYFDRSMPERQALQTIESRFGRTNEIVFVLRAADGGSMLEGGRLEALNWLAGRVRNLPEAIAARSPLDLAPATAGQTPPAAEQIRRAAVEAGFSARSVLSQDETVAAVAVIYPRSSQSDIDIEAVTSAARALQADFRARFPGVEALMTGRLMMDRAFIFEGQQDTYDYAAVQTAILMLVLLITFRSLYAAGMLMAMVLLANVGVLGAAGWSGFPLNGISSAAPTVLLGLAIATGIHIVLAWQRALSAGMDRRAAVVSALAFNLAPVTLSVVTTVISFLCLNLAASPPFGELGNVVSLGLIFVLILSFTLLPALLLMAPKTVERNALVLTGPMRRLAHFVIRRRRGLLASFLAVFAFSIVGVLQLRFDDTFAHYFDERFEVRRATDLFESKLSGTTFIDFSVPVKDEGGPFGRAHLEKLGEFTAWLRSRWEFAEATSLETVTRELGRQAPELLDDQGLPARAEADAALRAAYDRMRADGLIGLIDASGRHARLSVVLRDVSSAEILAFTGEAKRRAEAIFGGPVIATGLPILSAQLSIDSTRTMMISMALALAAISILMLAALRDARLGLISLLPNIVPALAAVGLWGVFVGEVSFAATVVGALTFGIVVDDTVHLLMKYQAERRQGLSPQRAIQQTFRSVGVAVVVTSLAIILSFGVFIFSGFLVNQHLGWLTGITMIAALIADLLFLPPLLIEAEKTRLLARLDVEAAPRRAS